MQAETLTTSEALNNQAEGSIDSSVLAQRRVMARWLFTVAGMVVFMIVLGGVTRLTESGLSMVDWRPVTGWLPPLTDAEWQRIFDAYRLSPEYREVNIGMTLAEFKEIFWLEYLHRLWGRLIGLAFALPLVFFGLRGWLTLRLSVVLVGLFILGGAQGVLGWYMVQSGLVDRPDVSQYRLAAHLIVAFIVLGALLWTGYHLNRGLVPGADKRPARLTLEFRLSLVLIGVVLVTVTSGALVAGLNAGLIYNTFPLMGDRWVPVEIGYLDPWYLNWFENLAAVQFNHRVLALTTASAVLVFGWWLGRRRFMPRRVLAVRRWAMIAVLVQAALGVSTLLMGVPLVVAALHQFGAVVLFSIMVKLAFALRRA